MKKCLAIIMMASLFLCLLVPAANASGDYLGYLTVVNCSSWVTLRDGPSTRAGSVAKVPLGATVEAYYFNSQFAECYYNGMHGYILTTYLSIGSGTASSTSSDYLGKMYVVNCSEFVTLRQYASTQAPSLTKVAKGQQVDAYYYDGYFCRCFYNGLEGYILSQYLSGTYSNYVAPSAQSSKYDSSKDLSNFDYRQVVELGRGSLVFQKSPRGSFMKNHTYHNGDWIYVNLYWRKDGYAIAYEDGVYGYVDASYIDW